MKKLMVAVVSAASAMLAFGDLPHGAGFEANAFTVGASFTTDKDDAGGADGTKYWSSSWSSTAAEEIGAISNGTANATSVPDMFSEDQNTKYLHIDTSGKLYRNIAEAGAAVQMDTGDGIYLDTLVQFTAADQVFGTDALGTGDKIAIEYAATDDGITNFVVRAGVVGSAAANYLVNAPANFDVNAWHRLTVRTVTNIDGTLPGFKIYLDEVLLAYATDNADFAQSSGITDDTHTIFPSAVTSGDYKTTISAVAFTGNGSLDDVVFTSTTPNFIKASEAVVATFTADAGVTAITVTVGQTDYNVDMTALTVSLPAGTTTFTVTATIDSANGYSLASLNGGNSNPATVSDYAGDTIAISTTRNNFTLFDENGDAISGTFETLAQAMAATGVAKIQLAYDYDAITFEGKDFAGYTIAGDVVLDLAGNDFNGGDDSAGTSLFTVSGTLTIIDSVGGGKITYDTKYGYAIVKLTGTDAFIGATTGDEGATFDGQLFESGFEGGLIRAKVKVDGNTTNDKLTWTVAPGSECAATAVDGYWVVAPAAPAVTWATLLGEAVDGAYLIDNLTELKAFQANIASTTDESKLATTGLTFKLTADIALDEPWDGIGLKNGKDVYSTEAFNAAAFCGTFDGQNHTISGFQMVGKGNNAEGLDYCGFFNSTYGATIQNLKIAYAGSLFAADTTASTKESGATFVGVAKNSTLKNLTTVAGTVSSSKGFGGIVGYLTSGSTVDSCTNNLNMTSLADNKCGGIAMITQGGSAVTIKNCQNNGTQTTGSSNSEYGAIVGYIGLDTTISNCETTVGRFLKHQGNTVTLQGVNKGDATVLSYHGAATPGLNFATVDGTVATFVADGALAAGNTYKVLGPSATATFEFAAAGTIAFDTNLTQNVTFAITAAQESGLKVTDATADGVVTFTAAAAEADWTDETIPAGTSAATQYPALAYTALATADAGKLTEWATTQNVEFSAVTADAASYVDAFLLNCAPTAAAVAEAKEDFKLDITVNADGSVKVTAPEGYNVTPTIQGKQSLSDKTWHDKTEGDQFFRAVLDL